MSDDSASYPDRRAPPRLLDVVRDRIRVKHYSLRTEQAYVDWIRRYVRFHGNRHPSALGQAEVAAFLTNLAVELHVAASTQNQAQSALLFLYREVLGLELPLTGVERARASARLPVVLTPEEVAKVLRALSGTHRLFGELLYGSGMRIMEGVRLRVKDVDLARRELLVRDGKGDEARDRANEADAAEALLAVVPEVVEDDQRSVGPAAEDGLIETQGPDRGIDVVGPQA